MIHVDQVTSYQQSRLQLDKEMSIAVKIHAPGQKLDLTRVKFGEL